MENQSSLMFASEQPTRRTTWFILLGAGIMFLILQFGVTFLVSFMDQTWSAVIGTATMLAFVLAYERIFFARRPIKALGALGWVRANPRAILVAVILSLINARFLSNRITGDGRAN